MMSAWVIGLGIAAGYLINKNVHMQKRLTESVQEFQESAKPAEPGPQSKEIRAVQRSVPASERYESLNLQDLDRKDVDALVNMKDAAVARDPGRLPPARDLVRRLLWVSACFARCFVYASSRS